jgi:Fe-S-cluster containining protein
MTPTLNIAPDLPEGEFQRRYCFRCGGLCCKKGVFVPLKDAELKKMCDLAHQLQRDVVMSIETVDGEEVWVMSNTPYPCGFLDLQTNRCLIYKDRPDFCKTHFCEPRTFLKPERK